MTDERGGDAAVAAGGGAMSSRAAALALAAVSVAAVALPFLTVRYPPIADLPQQAAQIRLLLDSWGDPAAGYRVQWWSPNRLSYLFLGAGWLAFGPRHAGRVAMLAIGVLWVAAAHALARRRGRPAEAAVLASLLFFNPSTYWGFYSFECGLPAFVLWLDLTTRLPERLGWRDAVKLVLAAALLFLCHALWLAAGLAWLGAWTLAARGLRAAVVRGAVVLPVLGWAAAWNATLAGTSFDRPSVWSGVAARFQPAALLEATLGGLRGRAEVVVAGALAAWVAAGAIRRAAWRRDAGARPAHARWDRPLLLAAALFALAAWALPDGTHGTILFAARWTPIAVFAAVLAAPSPTRHRGLAAVAVSLLALWFGRQTADAWRSFERWEMSGLEDAVAALPERPRVLGLDFVRESGFVRGRPFLQTFAYAQLARGGDVFFTFATFPSSLVVLESGRKAPWTRNLEWDAERVKRSDLAFFDHVLVNADESRHARIAGELGLAPVTASGRWRLYRPAPAAEPEAPPERPPRRDRLSRPPPPLPGTVRARRVPTASLGPAAVTATIVAP